MVSTSALSNSRRLQAAMVIGLALAQTQATKPKRLTNIPQSFQDKYYFRPDLFMQEIVQWYPGEAPTAYQLSTAMQLLEHVRLAERGPHGLGKTSMIAQIILWFALTRDGKDWKAPTTASAWRQLSEYLWPEIHKWARRLNWSLVGRPPFNERHELQTLSLTLATGSAFAVASNQPALIEGAHADHLLYIFDEAKTIPGATFDSAEGAFSGAGGENNSQADPFTPNNTTTQPTREAYAIAVSTPGEPYGRFYDIHSRKPGYEDWFVRHVTLQEAIDAGRVSEEWAQARKRQWGPNSAAYMNRVEGEFWSSEDDTVIPLAWLSDAQARWKAWDAQGQPNSSILTHLGIDVARSGSDHTVFAFRHPNNIIGSLRKFGHEDTMETAGRAAGILSAFDPNPRLTARAPAGLPRPIAVVDVIGLGAGVYDRLLEGGYEVEAYNASSKSWALDLSGELGFVNRRAESWWKFRERLDPSSTILPRVALPPDSDLIKELTVPRWKVVSDGKIQIESKEFIKKRLGHSTDTADPVIQAFAEPSAQITELDDDIAEELFSYAGT